MRGQNEFVVDSLVKPFITPPSIYYSSNTLLHIIIMKGLKRADSKEQPKPFQKPEEDLQAAMNRLEAKRISEVVGMDGSEQKRFEWFYELIIKLKLPSHYKRYLNQTKDSLIYYNTQTQQEQYLHPSISTIKIFFYSTLANNKAAYTFAEKQTKLLPFVEEKMLRQSMGLSSKRRDAEKVNLQRDQSGRLVMSKLQRIVPDFKALIASRSYMLKMLVEKLFTKKQLFGKGKRANAYTSLLSEYRKLMKQSMADNEEDEAQNEYNLALYQKVFEQAGYFYVVQFGNLSNIPYSLINSRQYVQSTPENVLKNIFLLNIDKDNIELYWLARIMDCLPMPPNWTKRKGATFDSYVYEPEKLLFDIHPSYIYVMYQMNRFRSVFKTMGAITQNYYLNMRQLNFYDFFERQYTVDMFGYIQNAEKKSVKAEDKGKEKDTKNLKSNQTCDWMILEGIRNTPIDPANYMLAENIEAYWDSLDFKFEPFCPAVSPYGEVVWSSNVNYKSITFNPYRSTLTNIIRTSTNKVPNITLEVLKKQFRSQLRKAQPDEQEQEQMGLNLQRMKKERGIFLKYYIGHQSKALPWPYQIKEELTLLNENNFYQQLFVCPFQLDEGILAQGEAKPFWLQKVHAKNAIVDYTNMLTFNPLDFNSIKATIMDYILEMVGQHEPHSYEQTEKKLKRLNNPEELLRYLVVMNDLQAREQRKKEYLESQQVEEDDSDIFGSDISQMSLQDLEAESQEQVVKEQEQVQQLQEIINEPEPLQQVQEEVQPTKQMVVISEQQQSLAESVKEDYSFLLHFIKAPHRMDPRLQRLKEEALQQRLQLLMKEKKRKNKYKFSHIGHYLNQQITFTKQVIKNKIFGEKEFHDERIKIKKNLIVSKLRRSNHPYFIDQQIHFRQYQIQEGRCLSDYNYSQASDYSQFQSEIADYQNDSVDEIVTDIRRQRFLHQKLPTQSERHYQHEQTQDTIELEPIYQTKPQIRRDPILRHIKQVSEELDQFRSTFNSKILKPTPQKDNKKDLNQVKVLKKMNSLESNYSSLPNATRNNFIKNNQRSDQESRASLTKKESLHSSLPKFQTPHKAFYRVCLQHTASHFLQKEAFLRKGDLITMEARKTLLSKGRGLETFISKFY